MKRSKDIPRPTQVGGALGRDAAGNEA